MESCFSIGVLFIDIDALFDKEFKRRNLEVPCCIVKKGVWEVVFQIYVISVFEHRQNWFHPSFANSFDQISCLSFLFWNVQVKILPWHLCAAIWTFCQVFLAVQTMNFIVRDYHKLLTNFKKPYQFKHCFLSFITIASAFSDSELVKGNFSPFLSLKFSCLSWLIVWWASSSYFQSHSFSSM